MKNRPVLTYLVLAFGISWLAALVLHGIALQAGLADFGDLMSMAETTFSLGEIASQLIVPTWMVFLLSRIVDFGPSIAGLVTPFVIGEPDEAGRILRRLFDFRTSGRWYAWALLLPLGIVLAAFGLHLALGDSQADLGRLGSISAGTFIGQLLFWVLLMRTLLGGGLGEELGWRGFALPRLTARFGAVRASWIIGLVWTIWHLPAHLASDSPLVNLIVQLLYTVPLTFIFTWLYYRAGEKLLPVVLMHGALNGFNAFFERTLFPVLADEDGFVIFFILVTLIVGLVFAWKVRRLDREARDGGKLSQAKVQTTG